ncbi:MAG: hypothetical protein ACXWLL_12500 [Myxococcaceae bacterium]
MRAALPDELEVPARDRTVAELHRAAREPADLRHRAEQGKHPPGVPARHACQQGADGESGAPGREQRADESHGGGHLDDSLHPEACLRGEPDAFPWKKPAAEVRGEHRAPDRTRRGATEPDAILAEVELEQPGQKPREADAVVRAPAHRPGSRLEFQVRPQPSSLEPDVHGRPGGQSTCQYQGRCE